MATHLTGHRAQLTGVLPAMKVDGIANAAFGSVEDGGLWDRVFPRLRTCPKQWLRSLFLICFRADDSKQSDVVC
jgi:hypothetical protein